MPSLKQNFIETCDIYIKTRSLLKKATSREQRNIRLDIVACIKQFQYDLVEEIDLIMIQDIESWINTLIKNQISFGNLFDFLNSVFDESFYDLIMLDMERCKNNLSESESLIHFGIINIETQKIKHYNKMKNVLKWEQKTLPPSSPKKKCAKVYETMDNQLTKKITYSTYLCKKYYNHLINSLPGLTKTIKMCREKIDFFEIDI